MESWKLLLGWTALDPDEDGGAAAGGDADGADAEDDEYGFEDDDPDNFDADDDGDAEGDGEGDAATDKTDNTAGETGSSGDEGEQDTGAGAGFDDDLIARAADLGLSEEEAREFGTPGALTKALDLLEKRQTPDQPEEGGAGDGDFEIKLDPDVYEPEIIDAFKTLKEQVIGLKAELARVSEAAVGQAQSAFQERVDRMIEGLGTEYATLFGKGPGVKLDPAGAEARNRSRIVDEMETIRTGLEQRGKPVPKEAVLFERAVNSVFGKDKQTIASEKLRRQLNRRSRQAVGRPSHRNTKGNVSPTRAAVASVAQKLEAWGVTADGGDDE